MSLQSDLKDFNRAHPHHISLDHIDSRDERTICGESINKYDAFVLLRLGLVSTMSGPFGIEVELTKKGRLSLENSRDAFAKI